VKAKELMIPIRDFLSPENTLKDAVKLLKTARRDVERQGVKGLPVLDAHQKVIGILSMQDILKAVYPSYMSMMNLGNFTWDGMVESLAKQAGTEKVASHMSRDVMTVQENDSLMECVDLMIKHHVKRLPVLDQAGKVVGMIYERDIFYVITSAMLDENQGSGK
jgi:CBS-domain-containing membrane protein